jgi:hypothetical protein
VHEPAYEHNQDVSYKLDLWLVRLLNELFLNTNIGSNIKQYKFGSTQLGW